MTALDGTIARIKERLNRGSSYSLGTDIAAIIADGEAAATNGARSEHCGVEGPYGWQCVKQRDEHGTTHRDANGGTWKGGVRP